MYKYKVQERGGSTIIVRCGVSSRAYVFSKTPHQLWIPPPFLVSFRLGNELPGRQRLGRKNKKPTHAWVGFATGSPEMFPSRWHVGWESDHLERSGSTLPVTDIGGLFSGQIPIIWIKPAVNFTTFRRLVSALVIGSKVLEQWVWPPLQSSPIYP